jgi:hypothetical protein
MSTALWVQLECLDANKSDRDKGPGLSNETEPRLRRAGEGCQDMDRRLCYLLEMSREEKKVYGL